MIGWTVFLLIIGFLLVLDLGVFHRKSHVIPLKEAIFWSALWITISLLFALGVYYYKGEEASLNFLTGYLLEYSLSIDNLFVFVAVFSAFHIPEISRHKVLFWGILGALVFRAIFIYLGLALVQKFQWIYYLLGIFLIFSGLQIAFGKQKVKDPSQNWLVKWFERLMPVDVTNFHTFFSKTVSGKTAVTPLFLALMAIETADVIFALDSIPAIFAITQDPFIVYTSNIFAILGMRSLYFVVSHVWTAFKYLNVGIGFILTLIGLKMLLQHHVYIPNGVVLLMILAIMGICIWLSIKHKDDEPTEPTQN